MRAPGRNETTQKDKGYGEDQRAGFALDQRACDAKDKGRDSCGEDRGGTWFDRQREIDGDPGAEEDRRPGKEMSPLMGENARGPGSFAVCCAKECPAFV
jgi:hypothetical protein